MFMSAASYAQIRAILKREGIDQPEPVVDQIDTTISTAHFIQEFGYTLACRGPNGERLRFIPVSRIGQ